MQPLTFQVTFGGLLHDIGKLVWRAGRGEKDHMNAGGAFLSPLLHGADAQTLLDCVRMHHKEALATSRLPANHPAYITCFADTVAAAVDRRVIENGSCDFDPMQPLQSVFTQLNGEHPNLFLPPIPDESAVPFPREQVSLTAADYQTLLDRFVQGFQKLDCTPDSINSLLRLLEECTSGVPCSTYRGQSADISLYDHLKMTAAISACISEQLMAENITDFRACFAADNAYTAPVFLLYTADLSGIQKFIYTVGQSRVQRALRSRSFFLELFMEHYIDLVLDTCGVSRANLLYSGGGHCYLLLPNTEQVRSAIKELNKKVNDWLIDQFGIQLFLANGWAKCSANALRNYPPAEAPYKQIFAEASATISRHKLQRYKVDQVRRLNQPSKQKAERECVICGRSDVLPADDRCPWCSAFENISRELQDQQHNVFCVTRAAETYALKLPDSTGQSVFLLLLTEEDAAQRLQTDRQIIRLYSKNHTRLGTRVCTRLDLCGYFASNRNDELASQSEGIRRLAICRMDVDNLGEAFVSGFERKMESNPTARNHFVTLSRTAAFSRQMSLFFKRYMTLILSGGGAMKPLQVSVVYSGGDDVFLLGAWNETIEAAKRIHQAFARYTAGALTISAGVGMYHEKYPFAWRRSKRRHWSSAQKNIRSPQMPRRRTRFRSLIRRNITPMRGIRLFPAFKTKSMRRLRRFFNRRMNGIWRSYTKLRNYCEWQRMIN